MAIKAGTVNDFNDSMAEAMELAMKQEYQNLKGVAMPTMGENDRRLLLCAIAQGVVRYLKDNLDAFSVSTVSHQVSGESDAPLMRSDNPSSIAVSGGGGGSITAHAADVTQLSGSSNMIKTRGTATLDELDTTGTLY